MKETQVLIVEDEIFTVRDLQMTLACLGYANTSFVQSGEEAIEKVKEVIPDIVIMDIVLQGKMDGIEAAEKIHSSFDIPVIFLTAHSDNETLERAKRIEPFGYITKPFKDKELRSTIEMAMYKHKGEATLNKQRESFISVFVHDLKGPLVPLHGYMKKLIDRKVKSEEDRMRIFTMLREATDGLAKIGNISGQAAKFVEKTKGKWDQLDWEKFVKDIQQRGIDLTEETKENLEGILESVKEVYLSLPLIAKKGKKEPKITKASERFEALKIQKAKVPKKEKKPSEKKRTEKVKIEKDEGTRAAKTIKAVPLKKKAAKASTAKESTAIGTTKTRATSTRKRK